MKVNNLIDRVTDRAFEITCGAILFGLVGCGIATEMSNQHQFHKIYVEKKAAYARVLGKTELSQQDAINFNTRFCKDNGVVLSINGCSYQNGKDVPMATMRKLIEDYEVK